MYVYLSNTRSGFGNRMLRELYLDRFCSAQKSGQIINSNLFNFLVPLTYQGEFIVVLLHDKILPFLCTCK